MKSGKYFKNEIDDSYFMTHKKHYILEMENQSSQNEQNFNFTDLMVGPEVEFRMYRAQIKT